MVYAPIITLKQNWLSPKFTITPKLQITIYLTYLDFDFFKCRLKIHIHYYVLNLFSWFIYFLVWVGDYFIRCFLIFVMVSCFDVSGFDFLLCGLKIILFQYIYIYIYCIYSNVHHNAKITNYILFDLPWFWFFASDLVGLYIF